jgi:DNA-binding MarR family transcriptional regulator/GNAT superfamily N-acetyltransferase
MDRNAQLAKQIDDVRRFGRFYTRQIGLLSERYLGSPLSLTEARILYELGNREGTAASELHRCLNLDAGYLSRILKAFERKGLVERRTSERDGRRLSVSLTQAGSGLFARINSSSRNEIGAMLERLSKADRERVVSAMRVIESILGSPPERRVPYILRPHQPGDMGWIVHRQGVLYAREYGWDETFEALVAELTAKFINNFDAARERCWIAERDGELVGSVFLVKQSSSIAKLRLLYVEPHCRGLGIGRRLVDECGHFARRAGYRKIALWTNSILVAARHIYAAAGYRLVKKKPHRSFGHDLVGETWELGIDRDRRAAAE